ncbi:hypothetical protein PSPO01_09038 [Paraphaeosphaeria sporulosa]
MWQVSRLPFVFITIPSLTFMLMLGEGATGLIGWRSKSLPRRLAQQCPILLNARKYRHSVRCRDRQFTSSRCIIMVFYTIMLLFWSAHRDWRRDRGAAHDQRIRQALHGQCLKELKYLIDMSQDVMNKHIMDFDTFKLLRREDLGLGQARGELNRSKVSIKLTELRHQASELQVYTVTLQAFTATPSRCIPHGAVMKPAETSAPSHP